MKKEKDKKETTETGYRIFARKFRPENFDELIGQETVAQLLKNAIRSGRIPQNFLFAGPRGIGKTSTARILAKALNCAQGPAESPCNECAICQEITRTVSFDVLEIDGASNRGIEEIRTLRENVKFKPAQARFKIYIIDEVHMLTGEAFNALLKTLEEPPDHVKFIFATTEPHKVPLTILSRCQRFNFKRIPTETIVEKLKEIAKEEKLKPEAKALFQIARVSDGSLRDAETLLDQLSALSKGEISEEDVLFTLGLAGEDAYFKALEALQKKSAEKILTLTKELYEAGKDLAQFGRGLQELFRNLLLLQIGGGAEAFVEMSPESKKELGRFKETFSREELLLVLALLQNLQGDLRRALAPPKLLIETVLLKLLHLEGLHSVKELLEQVDDARQSEPRPSPRAAKGLRSDTSSSAAVQDDGTASDLRKDAAEKGISYSLADIEQIWPNALEAVKAKEMSTGMFLAEAAPVEVNEGGIVIGFPEEFRFHKEMLERVEKRKLVEQIFTQFLGCVPRIQFVTTRVETQPGTGAPPKPGAEKAKLPDIVRQAMDIFQGSKIVRAD